MAFSNADRQARYRDRVRARQGRVPLLTRAATELLNPFADTRSSGNAGGFRWPPDVRTRPAARIGERTWPPSPGKIG